MIFMLFFHYDSLIIYNLNSVKTLRNIILLNRVQLFRIQLTLFAQYNGYKQNTMNSEVSRDFTFKANSSHMDHMQLGRQSKIITEPSRQQYVSGKSNRKYKIFEQSPLFSNSIEKEKKVNQSPKAYKTQTKHSQTQQSFRDANKTLLSSQNKSLMANTYKGLAKNTLDYQGTSSGIEREKIISELTRKERQINMLRLEIQRTKRCEDLAKNNQHLYQQILKNQAKQAQIPFKKKENIKISYTPIQSLTQIQQTPIKQINAKQGSPTHTYNARIPSTDRYQSAKPLKTILQNQQIQSQQRLQSQKIQSFKNTPQSKHKVNLSFQSNLYSNDPLYRKIESQMDASRRSISKSNMNNLPINMRLKQMNRALQYNYKEYSRRSSLSSQRKPKNAYQLSRYQY